MNLALWTILILATPLIATKAINGVYLAFLTLVILASFEAVQPLAQAFQFLGHSVAAGGRVVQCACCPPPGGGVARPLSPPPQHPSCWLNLGIDKLKFT